MMILYKIEDSPPFIRNHGKFDSIGNKANMHTIFMANGGNRKKSHKNLAQIHFSKSIYAQERNIFKLKQTFTIAYKLSEPPLTEFAAKKSANILTADSNAKKHIQ